MVGQSGGDFPAQRLSRSGRRTQALPSKGPGLECRHCHFFTTWNLGQLMVPLWNSFPSFVIWGCSPCPNFIHHIGLNNDRTYFLGMSNKPCKVQQRTAATIKIIIPFSGMSFVGS